MSSVKQIMQWEMEQLDVLEKLQKRTNWDDENAQFKKRQETITREEAEWMDRVKKGGGGGEQPPKVKLDWVLMDAHCGETHDWETAYASLKEICDIGTPA